MYSVCSSSFCPLQLTQTDLGFQVMRPLSTPVPCFAQVSVFLDEARTHKDVLHLFVTEGDDITIPLSATGLGQVVTCPAIADGIDFGPQFTGTTNSWCSICKVSCTLCLAKTVDKQ